jgi:tetratricopeptide (TPR) repeat protein
MSSRADPDTYRFRVIAVLSLALATLTLAVYIKARRYDFVNFDDPIYVTGNPEVLGGLTFHGLAWAATTGIFVNWHPLTWVSLQLDVQLFGPGPAGFHTTNVLLHVVSTVLLFWALARLTSAPWLSALVAPLFGLHPLHVESVAWIAERKDVLSGLFWMLTLYAYARYVEESSRGWYAAALAAFALGLMAKPMLVTLPFVLLLLDYWPLGRLQIGRPLGDSESGPDAEPQQRAYHRDEREKSAIYNLKSAILEKWPFFALSAVSCIVTLVVQRRGGADLYMSSMPWPIRLANAPIAYISYIGKMLWPRNLAIFYPYPPAAELWWRGLAALLLLICLTMLAVAWRRSRPYLLVGWLWYLGTLVPVSGLVPVGLHAMADRYTYLPLIGLFIACVWGIADWAFESPRLRAGSISEGRPREDAAQQDAPRLRFRLVWCLSGTGILAACTVLAWQQLDTWRNSFTLWEHAIEAVPGNYAAHYNLAAVLHRAGKLDEARRHYAETLRINPAYPAVKNAIGLTFLSQGRPAEALPYFSAALEQQPDFAAAHLNRGLAQMALGDPVGAESSFTAAIKLDPDSAEAESRLGEALCLEGKMEAAAAAYRRAIALEPASATHYYDLAYALYERGRIPEAEDCYRQALHLEPKLAENAERRAWVLATHPDPHVRNGLMALRLGKQACQATGYRRPEVLDTLAAAYAENSRFDEAQATLRQALDLLKETSSPRSEVLEARLELYRRHQPFRDRTGMGHSPVTKQRRP